MSKGVLSQIELEITRGPATVFADNQDDKITSEIGYFIFFLLSGL
jgi:hypothetical protein